MKNGKWLIVSNLNIVTTYYIKHEYSKIINIFIFIYIYIIYKIKSIWLNIRKSNWKKIITNYVTNTTIINFIVWQIPIPVPMLIGIWK